MADPQTVPVNKIDLEGMTCEQVDAALRAPSNDPNVFAALQLKQIECNARRFNDANPNDRVVAAATFDQDDPNRRILFGLLKFNDAASARDAAKLVLAMAGKSIAGGDPLTTKIVDAVGTYSIDAYFDAASRNDPLLIVFPTAVPGAKLTTDAVRNLRRGWLGDLANSPQGGVIFGIVNPAMVDENGRLDPNRVISPIIRIPPVLPPIPLPPIPLPDIRLPPLPRIPNPFGW